MGDQLKTLQNKSATRDETLTIKFVNSWIYDWLRSNPLVCVYTSEGNNSGLLDFSRIEYFFKNQGLIMTPECFDAFKFIERGSKQQVDKERAKRADESKKQLDKMKKRSRS